jgi:hypothetical protein
MEKTNSDELWIGFLGSLNEVQARQLAGLKALEFGWGGISKVGRLTGMDYKTIKKGMAEVENRKFFDKNENLRKKGAGRKKLTDKNHQILKDLETIMDENTAGDPMSNLKWSNKSTYAIANELRLRGHKISEDTVGRILKQEDYSLQSNKKTLEGSSSLERDEQFNYINGKSKEFVTAGEPVISVDAKKKELVGNFKNNGQTWKKKGEADEVNVYDFLSLAEGRITPYGAYDLARNEGFVNVGISYDTAEFAVESIRRWWNLLGRKRYPNATKLLITADGGGSNGSRNKGWKQYLQNFANETNLEIVVCHFPPGTSKWNKIEHRMFSFISINWKGKPLTSYETVVNLIKGTTTTKGLRIDSQLDVGFYEKGKTFSEKEMAKLELERHKKHPNWNYTIKPQKTKN